MAVDIWVGWHGEGKTYCCTEYCARKTIDAGQVLVTNLAFKGAIDVREFKRRVTSGEWRAEDRRFQAVHFDTWDELIDLIEVAAQLRARIVLLIDEGGKFLAARFWNKLDPRILMLLQERRKFGVDLHVTVPSFKHVDANLRDVAQAVHLCKRWGGTEYSHDGGRKPWFFYVRSYRPDALGDGPGNAIKRGAKASSRRLVPFSTAVGSLYDTVVLDMGKPMAEKVAALPDYRGDQAQPTVVAVPVPVGGKRGR